MFKRFGTAALALAVAGAASMPAHAAIDVSAVVTEIGTGAAPIAAVGAAVLIILAGVKIWKLVRRAL